MNFMKKLGQMMGLLSQAAKDSDRSVASVALEMVRLRLSVGRVGPSEYLDFHLYRRDIPLAQKRSFAGWRAQQVLEEILVDDYSRFVSLDKLTMYCLLNGYGLATPRLHGVYRSPCPSTIRRFESPAELAEHLRAPGSLPTYVKPAFGSYGRGNALIAERRGETLVLGDGSTVELQAFCESLDSRRGLGWIFQEPLTSHREIAQLCGDKISGVRAHTFLAPEGPVITKAVWKINAGTVDSDNFCHGASGNLLGAIDVATGEITRVVGGAGAGQRVNPPHPITGRTLVGFKLPQWDQIKQLLREAQLAFPGYLCPGWDIAVCADGPKLLEVNFFGDVDLSQHAYASGFLDDKFLELMRRRGLDGLLNGSNRGWLRSAKNGRRARRAHHWNW
jgi:hypothetical protein